jgi:hypothetical protein
MRNPEKNPYDSAAPKLFAAYPADSDIGILVRQGDARWRLSEMAQAEEEIRQREASNAAITDRIERARAEHELNMHYLIHFGVAASERREFQRVLEQVGRTGELSLREAAGQVRTQGGELSETMGEAPRPNGFTGRGSPVDPHPRI